MSTLKVAEATYHQIDAIEVTDIGIHKNAHTPTTMDFAAESPDQSANNGAARNRRKPGQLKMLDDLYGPLKIGPYTITRCGLDALGATINGGPLNGHNTHFRTPSRTFVNSIQFNYPDIEKRMKASTFGDDYLLPSLLFEMATTRPPTSPDVIRQEVGVNVEEGSYHKKMSRVLRSAQNLDLRLAYSKQRINPSWAAIKSHSTIGASVGFQLFGLFMGARGIYDAVRKKDEFEIIFNSVGVGTEVFSIVTDVAVSKVGQHMITAGNGALRDFAKTRAGLRFARSGGLIGAILTVPFDIASAIKEFSAASNTTGKEAMDHYVSAGLNIASAAMTLILASAAMAGFSFAGPVGLVAGAFMAIGSQVYGAVRMVDEIDDYIELSVEERWRTGWFSFVPGMEIDKAINHRYLLAKARIDTAKELETASRKILDETYKDTAEAVVNGGYTNRIKRRRERQRNWLGENILPIVETTEVVGADDTIDARNGVTAATPGAVLGTPGETKGVIWKVGDGKDTIKGVLQKPNAFYYGKGLKTLNGGDKDDHFIADKTEDALERYFESSEYSTLRGGAGRDTLIMDGQQSYPAQGRGYDIDLPLGALQIYTPHADPSVEDGEHYSFRALLESIENVQTLAGGKSVVTGTDDANVITSRGSDTIYAGAGDDSIYLLSRGAHASGESGTDFYHVALPAGDVCISEDGIDESHISLGWRVDHIESWQVKACSLFITLTFDFHEGRRSSLCIDDVYKKNEGQRILVNNKLTFITRDGYHLKADLPETIDHDNVVDIQAEIIKIGRAEKTIFLKKAVCHVPSNQNTNYYVQRFDSHVQFITGRNPDAYYGTRIFLDYDSAELTRAQAKFATTPTIKMGMTTEDDKNKVNVSCDFLFHFGSRQLQLAGVGQYPATTLDVALKKASENISTHGYMLVFRDGKSHTVHLEKHYAAPPKDYRHSVTANTYTHHDLKLPLRMKADAVFELPQTQTPTLDHVSSCLKVLPVSEQTAIDNIEGAGATYLIHMLENRIMRISTPGGLATAATRLNESSTWVLDATQIRDFTIELANNQLYIATTTIFLPQYGADDLIDQIFVIGPRGVVHTVDLSFDRIYINSLDARYFEPPTAAETVLPQEFLAVADKVLKVRNIGLDDGTVGDLQYSMADRKWMLDSDKTRAITYSRLKVTGRCSHQDPGMFEVSLPDN